MVLAVFAVTLDVTVLTVALPTLAGALKASESATAVVRLLIPASRDALHATKIEADCRVVQPVAGRCLDAVEAGCSQQAVLRLPREKGRCAGRITRKRISPDLDAADRLGRIDGWDDGPSAGWPALDND